MVTTVKRTSVHIGPMSLFLSEGTKIEVLGHQGDSLVVKYRNSKGLLPASDTNFNAKTMKVPEIAPETPAVKPVDVTVAALPAPGHDNDRAPTPAVKAKNAAKAKPVVATQVQQARQEEQPVYPPVNN